MLNKDYLYGISLAVFCCVLVVFFSQAEILKLKEFFKPNKSKKALGLLSVIVMSLVGIYGIWIYGFSRDYIGFILLITYLFAMTITDIRNRNIPDEATIFFAVLFLVFNILSLNKFIILNGFIGVIGGSFLSLIAHIIRKESIGLGDVKLMGCIGLIVGFPEIIYITTRGLVICAIYSIILLFMKKASIKSQLPLAPFILIGALI